VQSLNGGEAISSEAAFWISDGSGRSEITFKPTKSGQTTYGNVKVIERPGRAMFYTEGPPQFVEIMKPEALSWTDQVGSDFRPHAFSVIRGSPLEKGRNGVIENLEDGHSEGKVVHKSDGHIVVQMRYKVKPGSDESASLSVELDPAAGMRMVRFKESLRNMDGEGTFMDTDYRIEWNNMTSTGIQRALPMRGSPRCLMDRPWSGRLARPTPGFVMSCRGTRVGCE
jgi:hypothetical protein